jgi:hypothetical protein
MDNHIDTKVFISTEYNKFILLKPNREINVAHTKKLARSVKEKDLGDITPIIVNEKFEIIDGQHRYEMRKNNLLPIYYRIIPGLGIHDVIVFQTNNKNWGLDDYLHYHAELNKEHYVKARNFMKKNNIKVVNDILHLSQVHSETNNYNFKIGNYEFPENEQAVQNLYDITTLITDLIIKYHPDSTCFVRRKVFRIALVRFLRSNKIDKEHFYKNLKLKIEWLHPCSQPEDYIHLLKKIYNYNMKKHKIE